MASERRLTVEAGLTLFGSHVLITTFVMPWLAEWMPELALDKTDGVAVPSFSSLRFTIVGGNITDPGLWVYLGLVWLCFSGWVYLRQDTLREWGQELLTDSDITV